MMTVVRRKQDTMHQELHELYVNVIAETHQRTPSIQVRATEPAEVAEVALFLTFHLTCKMTKLVPVQDDHA